MVTKSDPQPNNMKAKTIEDQLESVDLIAPPPSACVLNESDHPLQASPVKESTEVAPPEKEEAGAETNSKPAMPPLRKRTSFWDIFRSSIHKGGGELTSENDQYNEAKLDTFVAGLETKLRKLTDDDQKATGQNSVENEAPTATTQSGHSRSRSDVGHAFSQQSSRDSEDESENATKGDSRPPLRRQTSMMNFALNMPWAKRTRRLTDSTSYSTSHAFPSSGIASRSSTFDSTNQNDANPSTLCHIDDQNGHQIAQDCVKFAHARHTIKTTKEIEILRKLSIELESAFRHQIDKVAILHSQLESVHWRQHDLQDENKHLRAQIGSLSEQIVHQQAQIEALRVTVKSLSTMMSPGTKEEIADDKSEKKVDQHQTADHDTDTSAHNSILQHYEDNDSSHESTEASTPPLPKAESPKAIETEHNHNKEESIHREAYPEGKQDDPVLFSAGILSANATQTFANMQVHV
ncbi:uncharacterized protein FA14DRAFT_183728 [Meira miltonrushii]|uniref:Uncharacterized protein n=1 Tax=Meira miltonrushii TaxID=1280837 RepID=A0A316VKM8_9BASI|nr:uncharacterized protein FA14DRAFT_183728 [Meira miltonrushii]PWN38106.1 hypothetical protein FA14DRAFT_183728 [Meira miltonrushii]